MELKFELHKNYPHAEGELPEAYLYRRISQVVRVFCNVSIFKHTKLLQFPLKLNISTASGKKAITSRPKDFPDKEETKTRTSSGT